MKLSKDILQMFDQKQVRYIPGCTIVGTYLNQITNIEFPVKFSCGYYELEEIGCFSYISSEYYCGRMKIGRFCSIAPRVSIAPNLHPSTLLTHNNIFYGYGDWDNSYFSFTPQSDFVDNNRYHERLSYGNKIEAVEIGNDVWIGSDVIIMNGIKIGNGAIVAGGSVVTKDVPAYAIVGGNPAKIIRYRFEPQDIEELERIKWWDYGPEILKELDLSDIKTTIKHLQERVLYMPKYIAETLVLHHDTGTIELKNGQ